MSAALKTSALKRVDLPIDALEPNSLNPNKMSGRAFDLLVDNIQKTGLTDPILVRPLEDNRWRIVGGHHRWEAARYLGLDTVPCTVIDDPDFDADAEAFQLVRMNVIRGKMDPQAFMALYQQVSDKYSEQVLQDLFGFSEQAEFDRLVKQTAKSLPPDMKERFKQAASEVKTIDGLARVLNEMFTRYGDSLPYGYMSIDYGGQHHVWLRVSKQTMNAVYLVGDICKERSRTMDDVFGRIVQMIAKGELPEALEKVVADTPQIVLPAHLEVLPTKDHLAAVAEL